MKRNIALSLALIACTPTFVLAQETIQSFLLNILAFINNTLVPLIFAIAFLVFLWNTFRYFILGGGQEAEREKAKRFMLWSIIAFVIMISIWGIVNLFVYGFGFNRDAFVCPDYLLESGPPCWGGSSPEPSHVTPGEGIY